MDGLRHSLLANGEGDRPVAVPNSIGDVDAAWLTDALRTRFPGVAVRSATAGTVIHGTNTKIRYLLEYDEAGHAAGLPATMWFKGPYEPHNLDMQASNEGEVRFYREVSPTLPASVRRPTCYFAEYDRQAGRSALLIEDLLASNAAFGTPTAPPALPRIRALLSALADLHASHWQSDALADFPRLGDPEWGRYNGFSSDRNWFGLLEPGTWSQHAGTDRTLWLEDALRDPAVVADAVLAYFGSLRNGPAAILHGDAGVHNAYWLPDGTGGYVDWSSKLCGHWSWDVCALIIGGIGIDDRRRYARDLLKFYQAALIRHDVADVPSLDDMWLAFRRAPVWGLAMWTIVPESSQPDEYAVAMAQRFSSASADLETLAALGISPSARRRF